MCITTPKFLPLDGRVCVWTLSSQSFLLDKPQQLKLLYSYDFQHHKLSIYLVENFMNMNHPVCVFCWFLWLDMFRKFIFVIYAFCLFILLFALMNSILINKYYIVCKSNILIVRQLPYFKLQSIITRFAIEIFVSIGI